MADSDLKELETSAECIPMCRWERKFIYLVPVSARLKKCTISAASCSGVGAQRLATGGGLTKTQSTWESSPRTCQNLVPRRALISR